MRFENICSLALGEGGKQTLGREAYMTEAECEADPVQSKALSNKVLCSQNNFLHFTSFE
jgi:hypothetical protein